MAPTQQRMQRPQERACALITGATAGIGRAFAEQLAAAGHDLVLVARDAARLADTATRLAARHGVHAEPFPADLSTDGGVERVVERIERGPPIDVVVNNAGFGTTGALDSADRATQDRMVRLHVVAVNRACASALPGMRARGRGAIITVSSVASYLTSAGNANYCATKAYQRFLMQALWTELAGTGVHAQALCPGFTRTEFHARASMRMRHVPEWLWMTADAVVQCSLEAMREGRGPVIIPGWRNRAIVALLRHLPPSLLSIGTRRYRRDTAPSA